MDLFVQLSLIIVLATLVAGVMRLFKQPIIIGHIVTGILVGPRFLNLLQNSQNIEIFSQIGISILLFVVGIGLSPKIVREVGKVSLIMGVAQIIVTTLIGFLLCKAFGFNTISSGYVAIALTFSSTIIIMKLISDKKDVEKLYAKISVGFLLVQDIVATLLLIFMTTIGSGGNAYSLIALTLIKGVLLTLALLLISSKVLPKLSEFFASSPEYLFLFSLGWGFGLSILFKFAGFSVEIGALMAGITLSVSPYAQEIGSKLRPLRDFFIIAFFILLGSTLKLDNIGAMIWPATVFSLFVLVGNPLIVIIIMGILGYNRKTSFMAGLVVAQISEFSLILMLLAYKLGHVSQNILSLVTLVGLITIAGSAYMILYADKIYPFFASYLGLFEKKRPKRDLQKHNNYDVILFGCNRVGYDFIRIFRGIKENFLCVDFNPEVVKTISRSGVNCIYGDAEDSEFLEDLNLSSSKMVVSTIPDFEANEFLVNHIRGTSQEPIVIAISYDVDQALRLYDLGATYVILPHFIGGQFASELAHKSNFELKKLLAKREEHIDYLRERKSLGHIHPVWKHN